MKNKTLTFLSAADIKKCVTMEQAIEATRAAFISLSAQQANVPQRMRMDLQEADDCALIMPVHVPNLKQFGLKTVSIFNKNPEQNLPRIHALFTLFDSLNGQPIAVMDAEYLTALRTGAATGLATDLLARQDAKVVTIFGVGAQAKTQLEGVCAVRSIKRALVYAPTKSRTEQFAREMEQQLSVPVQVLKSPSELKQADIICTATTAIAPVFEDTMLRAGVHINGIGSYRPDMCEIPAETLCRAKLVVDSRSACLSEAGDIIQPLERGLFKEKYLHAEIGEIAAGTRQGRKNETEVTVFKSVGNAVQDLAVAGLAVKTANELDLGQMVNL